MSKTSHSCFRQHIELHFDDHDIDVVVRKRKQGYAIYWADDEEPLAQLRPTGNEDEVEVLYWDDVRWEPVREFGLSLPLDEALRYITDDPECLFFGPEREDDDDDADDEELDSPAFVPGLDADQLRLVRRDLWLSSMFGAAVGSLCPSLLWVLLAGACAAWLCLTRVFFEGLRHRFYLPILAMAAITAVVTAVGGVTGWAAHVRLGAGFGPLLAGVLVGALCISLLFQGGLGAWLAGLLVGLNLGLYLVAAWNIRDPFGGPLLIALLAAFGASQFCRWFTSLRKLTCDPAGAAPSLPTRPHP